MPHRRQQARAAFDALAGTDTPVIVARRLAGLLRVRSPAGVSQWTLDEVRAYYEPRLANSAARLTYPEAAGSSSAGKRRR